MIDIQSLRHSIGIFAQTYRYLKKSHQLNENLNDLKMNWARDILSRLNVELHMVGTPSTESSMLFVGNHISYLDIPLLMQTVPQVSFVAKEELRSWPLFGKAAQRIETVFVQREMAESRKSARASVQEALQNGKRIAIFPSGTTCLYEKKQWRKGAFEIAHQMKRKIQPFRISYYPLRAVAYIDQDHFPLHLYSLAGLGKIEAQIEFHEPVHVENPSWDSILWHHWARGLVNEV